MPADGARAPGPLESPRTLALLLFLLSLAVSGRSLTTHRQLAGLGGMVDEWFAVGLNYRVYGTLGIEPRRSDVTLSPGYPLFVAAVASAVGDPPVVTRQYFFRSMDAAFRNIGGHPWVYVRNCVRSFTTFTLAINSVFVRVFQYLQTASRAFSWLVAAVYASISAVHTFVYMDLMYFYVKVPFLLIF
ncbi:MAG: hypothetical protein ACHQNV_04440, partial [Vicinamibacteria bacterium]